MNVANVTLVANHWTIGIENTNSVPILQSKLKKIIHTRLKIKFQEQKQVVVKWYPRALMILTIII